MLQLVLFYWLRGLLMTEASDLVIRYNDIAYSVIGNKQAGIFIRGGIPLKKRDLSNGGTINDAARVQVLLQFPSDTSSLAEMLNLTDFIKDAISKTYNVTVAVQGFKKTDSSIEFTGNTEDSIDFLIIKADTISSVMLEGRTSQDAIRYSMNFEMVYGLA